MSKAKLSIEQIKEIAYNNELSLNKLAELYNTSRHSIVKIKTEYNTCKGRGRGCRSTGFKVSDQQKAEIIESKIPYDELAFIYNVHPSTIGKIKRKAGISIYGSDRKKIIFTDEQLVFVKDISLPGRKVEELTGISHSVITKERVSLGLSHREFRKANKKPRKVYKPAPKKEKIVKVIEPKVIVQKLKSEVKRASMIKSKFEEDNERKRKSENAKELYHSIEERKKAEGWRWITRAGKHGIKETVFIKQ